MNISINLPVWLVQLFLWGCVSCSFVGLLLLVGGWLQALVKQRRFWWVAIAMITMRQQKAKDWTWGQFKKLSRKLADENPEFHAQVAAIFNPAKPETTDITT